MSNRKGLTEFFRSHEHPGGIIVCEQKKFIYMKPGKTAGTSILGLGLEKRVDGIIHHKSHPEEYQEWLDRITDKELEEYYIFSVVRNPWDRLVSAAAYYQFSFSDFVNRLDTYWKKDELLRIHCLPLHLYTHLNGVQFVDMICRFESLQADMNLVFDQLDLSREKLAFSRKSKHRHYSTYYSNIENEIVETIYKKDIEYYGYILEDGDVPIDAISKNFIATIKHHLSRITKRCA